MHYISEEKGRNIKKFRFYKTNQFFFPVMYYLVLDMFGSMAERANNPGPFPLSC